MAPSQCFVSRGRGAFLDSGAIVNAALVPDFTAALRLDGRAVAVLGVGRAAGRQAAHALRQFGADVLCCDPDTAAAEAVAFEVQGHCSSAADALALLHQVEREALPLAAVVQVLPWPAARDTSFDTACALVRSCTARRTASLVLLAQQPAGAGAAHLEHLLAALSQELAEDRVRINAIGTAADDLPAGAGVAALLCADLTSHLDGHVLVLGSEADWP
jgi:hypothetical protein